MFTDERIDYTSYLRDKRLEKDPERRKAMYEPLASALRARGVRGHVSAMYYADGCVLVHVNGEYYGVFDSDTGAFFFGYVGDKG